MPSCRRSTLRQGQHVAEPVCRPESARSGRTRRCGSRRTRISITTARRESSWGRSATELWRRSRDRHRRRPHRPHEAGRRHPRAARPRGRQLRPHRQRDRPRLRHRGAVPACAAGGRQRRGDIGDIIPGHSGKGADFRLAERGYADYPASTTWWRSAPRTGACSRRCRPARTRSTSRRRPRHCAAGYIVGQLPRTIFYEPGVKETDWSATDVVIGADGTSRRWVYLHYFKEGQPTFNWLDPTFAAAAGGGRRDPLARQPGRADAAPRRQRLPRHRVGPNNGPAWSEGHPLSVTANQLIAGLVRKLGGFTFQELNLTLEDIKAMSQGGADLSYDFVTRPAYQHALVTGDAAFLRLMLDLQRAYGWTRRPRPRAPESRRAHLRAGALLDPAQGHHFTFRGKPVKGGALRDTIRAEMHDPPPGPRRALQPEDRQRHLLHQRHRGRRRPRHPRSRPASTEARAARHPARASAPGAVQRDAARRLRALRLGPGGRPDPCRRVRGVLDRARATRAGSTGAPTTCWAEPGVDGVEQRCRAPRPSTGRCPSSSRARTRSPGDCPRILEVRKRFGIATARQVDVPCRLAPRCCWCWCTSWRRA